MNPFRKERNLEPRSIRIGDGIAAILKTVQAQGLFLIHRSQFAPIQQENLQ